MLLEPIFVVSLSLSLSLYIHLIIMCVLCVLLVHISTCLYAMYICAKSLNLFCIYPPVPRSRAEVPGRTNHTVPFDGFARRGAQVLLFFVLDWVGPCGFWVCVGSWSVPRGDLLMTVAVPPGCVLGRRGIPKRAASVHPCGSAVACQYKHV
jgi:hypothetical protein